MEWRVILTLSFIKYGWPLRPVEMKKKSKSRPKWDCVSIGSNPNNTMNFELLRTWQVKLRTHSNPGSSSKTELQTHSNPFKKSELWTCLARNGPNLGPNLEKKNFKHFWTQVHLPKSNYEPTWTLQKFPTSNSWTGCGFDPKLQLEPDLIVTN